ncbi:RagB/SusD family nutrient uptake outer membrane protein [Pontibacter sp. 13R65]|uniref:RagB/SusD family nutrient uptake outer membrane protein n=1 Tax=Pontibacter sp. 13R65 TaxID=3127458 RepID=UPI00301D6388
MKKYIYYVACVMLLGGCKDVLDKPDLNAINPALWNNEATATQYLNRLYDRSMPTQGFGGNSNLSDEAPSVTNETPNSADTMYGRLGIDAVGNYSLATYQRIRDINIAIEDVDKGTLSPEVKARIKGQAQVMRAWEYWELVRLYGGVPMVLTAFDPFMDDMQTPRHTTSQAIDIIIADLDEAIAGLPAQWGSSERGRVTRGAAAALKARILLYWASPQFNPTDEAQRWQRAYTASKEAKELVDQDGKGLHNNFGTMFLVEGQQNKEAVFVRLYDFNTGKTHTWDNSARPRLIGVDGGQSSNPTKQLVDAFPMKNGLPITDPASGYDPVYYWKDRDPRFYSTIVYNGAEYEVQGFPAGRKQWQYYYHNDGSLRSVEPTAPTTTGFYTRKAVDPNIAQTLVKQSGTDWIEIRYAEVLMNLAEAANEIGQINEAYSLLSAIRERAGIEAGDGLYGLKAGMSKEEMRDAIMQERQVEFAFENKRYWDLRRRNLFEEDLNGTRRLGIRTVLKPEFDHDDFLEIRDNIDLDTEFDTYFTIEEWLLDEESAINYPQPQYNFFAIPSNILDRSPAVEQTMGWGSGSFDPLQ